MKKHFTSAIVIAVLAGVWSTGCDDDNHDTSVIATMRTVSFDGAQDRCTHGGVKKVSSSVKKPLMPYSIIQNRSRIISSLPPLGKNARSVRGSMAMTLLTTRLVTIIRMITSSTRLLPPKKRPRSSRPTFQPTPIQVTSSSWAMRRQIRYSYSALWKPRITLWITQRARQKPRPMPSKMALH